MMETRVIRDENGFFREQIRFLPLENWESGDGWRTTHISSCPPKDWPGKGIRRTHHDN